MLVISFGFTDIHHAVLQINILPLQISGFRGSHTAAVQEPEEYRALKFADYGGRPSFIRDYAVARLEKAGQFLFCKCMRYILALFQFRRLRNSNPCHAAIAKIFNEFSDDQRPDIAGAACLRIPLGAPGINHFLCKDAAVCEMVCTIPVKIFQVLCAGMFIPCAGCFPVADKAFNLLGETRTIVAHISNTPSMTGNFSMLNAHSRRCLISADV